MMIGQLDVYLEELHELAHELGVPLYCVFNFETTKVGKSAGGTRAAPFAQVESACAAISAMARYYEYKQAAVTSMP